MNMSMPSIGERLNGSMFSELLNGSMCGGSQHSEVEVIGLEVNASAKEAVPAGIYWLIICCLKFVFGGLLVIGSLP